MFDFMDVLSRYWKLQLRYPKLHTNKPSRPGQIDKMAKREFRMGR
jgi:hypothetical protein